MDSSFDSAVIDRLESIEHAGFSDFFRAATPQLADELGILAASVGGAGCFAVKARPGSILWNHATGLGRARPATEAQVDDVCRFFDNAGVQATIALTPDAGPPQLVDWLEARGFKSGYAWRRFSHDLGPTPQHRCELHIEALDKSRAGDFARVVARAFEAPESFEPWLARLPGRTNWHCYVAYADDTPAGAGALFVSGETAWSTFGATVPEFRGRGAQQALLLCRIEAARALGCTRVVTETGERADGKPESSYRNILWAGFEKAYLRPNYVRSA